MVGYMKRFSVTFKRARELLNQEILGTLLSFEAYAYSSISLILRKALWYLVLGGARLKIWDPRLWILRFGSSET